MFLPEHAVFISVSSFYTEIRSGYRSQDPNRHPEVLRGRNYPLPNRLSQYHKKTSRSLVYSPASLSSVNAQLVNSGTVIDGGSRKRSCTAALDSGPCQKKKTVAWARSAQSQGKRSLKSKPLWHSGASRVRNPS